MSGDDALLMTSEIVPEGASTRHSSLSTSALRA